MTNILWAIKFLNKNWKLMCIGVLCSLIAASMYSIYPWTLKILLDDVIADNKYSLLLPVIGALLSTVIVAAVAELAQTYIFTRSAQAASNNIRIALFNRIYKLPILYIRNQSTGTLMSYFMNDIPPLLSLYSNLVPGIVVSMAQILFQFSLLFYINLPLTLLTISFIPLYFMNHKFFKKTIARSASIMQNSHAEALDLLQESLTNIREIKTYDRNGNVINKLKFLFGNVQHNTVRNNLFMKLNFHLSNVITFGTRYIIYGVGAYFVLKGQMTIGELIAFVTYQTTLFNPIQRFLSIVSESQNVEVISGRLRNFFDETEGLVEKRGTLRPTIKGNIGLHNVSFKYPDSTRASVEGLEMNICAGEHIVIVGASGAGKTTLFHLIAGFFKATDGQIMIDEYKLTEIDEDLFRNKLGVMFQESVLFSGSIAENIRFSKPDATEAEIVRAAKLAYAHDFITRLPNGYETQVGSNGTKLSGGQRQRIALGRLFLQDPQILLLDEPTSALDVESAYEVRQALHQLMEGRTTIMITHDLHSGQSSDRIILMSDGKIVESGTHEQLISKYGLYYQVYSSQMRSGKQGD